MIWTIKIKLVRGIYANKAWEATIEIDSGATLEELHFAIQNAVNFDNDHLYEFYIAKTPRARNRFSFSDENAMIYETTLENLLPLDNGLSLFYLFDYGDSWLFKIIKSRKKPHNADKKIKYPRVIAEKGNKPEQYPSWD